MIGSSAGWPADAHAEGRLPHFRGPGQVLVVTCGDYELLLLAYEGEVLLDRAAGN